MLYIYIYILRFLWFVLENNKLRDIVNDFNVFLSLNFLPAPIAEDLLPCDK